MFKEMFTESLNEAKVSDKWALILKNADNIKATGYEAGDKSLDLAWEACKGCINYYETTKGKLYKIKGQTWSFFTSFENDTSLTVTYFDANNKFLYKDSIPLKLLTKQMKKIGSWSGTPIQINGVKTSKYSHFEKSRKWKSAWNFVFADGQVVEVNVYSNDEPQKQRADVLNKIAEIESWGYKIARKVQPDLERLLPDLFTNKSGFMYDKSIWMKANKISKDPMFIKFINNMDKESRTGHYITLYKDSIRVHGMVGNISSGYESKTFTFKKQPTTFAEFKKFFITSGALDYVIDLQKRMSVEDNAYANYIKNGGSLD